ncbi:MAG: hypothetical protein KJZ74_02340 [Gemmatimonadales bacterium]|nr:hypothetical protein [Gemmatimonadales bacterium]
MQEGPVPIDLTLAALCVAFEVTPKLRADDFLKRCRDDGPGGETRLDFHARLARWDYQKDPEWHAGTAPSTKGRRIRIYELLRLTPAQRQLCDELFPYAPAVDQVVVIADSKGWKRWYTPDRRAKRHFYWDAYERQLTRVRKWEGKNLAAISEATIDVVERFSDPESVGAVPTKGLVVGYVQSGKTANFTGVIARAADAGYRLFIVLGGTQNALRDQTQRRIDKELIGKELLRDEYRDSDDYEEFVSHGGRPSHQGSFDWERLTYAAEDFKHLKAGLAALTFKRVRSNLPFRDPINLHAESARLIVVKKNQKSLSHLLKSLKAAATHVQWQDVPSVVIDDESDQASLNTARPAAAEKKRTAINGLIVELLKTLRAAQYVGYTATPFANVLANPDDAEDLFPSDYLLPLPRPMGYMGVQDFYDDSEAARKSEASNERAYIRSVIGHDEDEGNLPSAIDAFVLSGALKLYRQSKDGRQHKHHTMLVHQSTKKADQLSQAGLVERLFQNANYGGSTRGLARLRKLWESDFQRVCAAKGAGDSVPKSFDVLIPFVGQCYSRIIEGDGPVLILNGDYTEDAPDFDRTSVWRIIVGGAKLSRGYTLEGLTISYYRRRAQAADTLMQMGRWFGYRGGYRDLVRLYIGRNEPLSKAGSRTIDLYDAFRGVCFDEEEFRDQLKRYSSLEEGERLTPAQVPPLIPSHMLRPTARNKMYNAKISFTNYGESEVQRTVAPPKGALRNKNLELLTTLLESANVTSVAMEAAVGGVETGVTALCAELAAEDVLEFLRGYRFGPGHEHTLQLACEFLEGKFGDPGINSWLVLAPQPVKGRLGSLTIGKTDFAVRERSRDVDESRYLVYSEPDHIRMARFLNGVESGTARNAVTGSRRKPRQGVLLLYPVRSKEEHRRKEPASVGFVLAFPKNGITKRVAFSVRDATQPDAVVVSAPKQRATKRATRSKAAKKGVGGQRR